MPRYALIALSGAAFALTFGCAAMETADTPGGAGAATVAENDTTPRSGAATRSNATQQADAYEQSEIVSAIAEFFGITAEAAGQLVERAFKDNGRPTGYIRGEEVAGAVGVGLRYGEGDLAMKNGQTRKVFWQGPSIGFDAGANASKVMTLVYGLKDADLIYQRFPGVNGSAYFIGGVGVSYARADDITLAPMRAGVGLRAGVNAGYVAISRERNVLPF